MQDISVSYDNYKFLGYEFLTWLWFMIENDQKSVENVESEQSEQSGQSEPVSFELGNRMIIENWTNDAPEKLVIKGDDAGLEEGLVALRKGALITEMNLSLKSVDNENEWRFTLNGENLNLSGLKTPDIGPVESHDDLEGAIIEKVFMYDKAISFIDALYSKFIKLRISNEWKDSVIPLMKKWISG